MNNMIIERAKEIDIDAIAQIAYDNLNEINSKFHSKEVMEMAFNQSTANALKSQLNWKEIFIAKIDNIIVGTAALANFGNDGLVRWCVSNVFVKIEYHGKGIGNLLVKTVIESAKVKNGIEIEVPSSRNAVGFYEKCGFTKPEFESEDEVTWLKMRLKTSVD